MTPLRIHRTGYNSLEKIEDPTHRRAIGFILTSFQKMNASSLRAIRAALNVRLDRLEKKLGNCLPKRGRRCRPAYRRRAEKNGQPSRATAELLEDEIVVLKKLLAMAVSHEKKIDRLKNFYGRSTRRIPAQRF